MFSCYLQLVAGEDEEGARMRLGEEPPPAVLDLEPVYAVLEEEREEAVVGVRGDPRGAMLPTSSAPAHAEYWFWTSIWKQDPRSRASETRPPARPRLSEMATPSCSIRSLVRAANSPAMSLKTTPME